MSWYKSTQPILGLSPMADFTDSPFCSTVKSCGGNPVVFREMVSAEALVRDNGKTKKMCTFETVERPIVQQIFGSDPGRLAEAARLIETEFHPDGIDINMGCPVYKAVSQFNGASIMRDHDLAEKIVKTVKSAINIPLSVKTRLGWSKSDEILEFVKVLEASGADLISVHGRTKEQGYSGTADWKMVGRAVKNVKIPVLVNGDIIDSLSAKNALEISGAHGLLIARGALGRPWIFERLQRFFKTDQDPGDPDIEDRLKIMREHAVRHIAYYGEKGLIKLRKHFPWYLKSIPNFRKYREMAVKVVSLDDLDILADAIIYGLK